MLDPDRHLLLQLSFNGIIELEEAPPWNTAGYVKET
jgi:hypothetical protein